MAEDDYRNMILEIIKLWINAEDDLSSEYGHLVDKDAPDELRNYLKKLDMEDQYDKITKNCWYF